jgi:DNA-binding IclR family transcriptional regulator
MRHGTVMSLRGTASGLLFAAHLPRAQLLPVLRAEAAATGRSADARIDPALAATLEQVRRDGLARAPDLLVPGISALASPVFDSRASVILALTAIGPSATFDGRPAGAVATALVAAAAALSARLGGGSAVRAVSEVPTARSGSAPG